MGKEEKGSSGSVKKKIVVPWDQLQAQEKKKKDPQDQFQVWEKEKKKGFPGISLRFGKGEKGSLGFVSGSGKGEKGSLGLGLGLGIKEKSFSCRKRRERFLGVSIRFGRRRKKSCFAEHVNFYFSET